LSNTYNILWKHEKKLLFQYVICNLCLNEYCQHVIESFIGCSTCCRPKQNDRRHTKKIKNKKTFLCKTITYARNLQCIWCIEYMLHIGAIHDSTRFTFLLKDIDNFRQAKVFFLLLEHNAIPTNVDFSPSLPILVKIKNT